MRLFTTTMCSAFALLTTSLFTNNATAADVYQRIDTAACDIEAKSTQLLKEVRHYRHTTQYQHLCQDARQLRSFARHIHNNVHCAADLHHLTSDLRQMDAEFHHLENLFDQVEFNASRGHGGHVHGDTRHVRSLLDAMEDCIHSLQRDLRLAQRIELQRIEAQRVTYDVRRAHMNGSYNTYGSRSYQSNVRRVPSYGSYQSSYGGSYNNGGSCRSYNGFPNDQSRGGITIGNGNVRFRINF